MAQATKQNQTPSLAVGTPYKLNDLGVLNNQTGQLYFHVDPHPNNKGDFSAIFQAIGSSLTGLSVDLQVALDNNPASLANYKATLLTAAAPVAAVGSASANPLVAGPLYALNITALTGTSCDIWVTIN